MLLLNSQGGIAGRYPTRRERGRQQSRGKRRHRPLFFERLEDRLCLSMWSDPVNLGPVINDAAATSRQRPAISSDDLSLYFSSDRPGHYGGGDDLWVSHRASVNDPWGEPQNLGPAINDPNSTATSGPNLSTDQH